jgi:hypothetical protein
LALGLEKAFSTKIGNVTVSVGGKGGRLGYEEREIGPDPKPFTPFDVPGNDVGDKPKQVPPSLVISLIPTPDEQMTQHLCRAQIDSGGAIMVFINEDHAVIVEAMAQRPVNKMLLNQVVVDEIANSVAALADDGAFIVKMFRPAVARKVNDIEDPRDKARTITRELIDRIHRPDTSEAAE